MLSSKTKLCVQVLVAMTSAPAGRAVTVQTLSHQLHVSVSHLESITSDLRKAGFISATRGPGGGYRLACDPEATTIWAVVQAVDAKLREPPALSPREAPVAALGEAVRGAFIDFLSARTIGEFADPTRWPQDVVAAPPAGFRLRPLPAPQRPQAPNSVFQLPAFPRLRHG